MKNQTPCTSCGKFPDESPRRPDGRGYLRQPCKACARAHELRIDDGFAARFNAGFSVDASGCWLWERRINGNGYGATMRRGRNFLAHRVSYEMHHGPIPPGLVIDHLCRNRRCVRPDHLRAVTLRENSLAGEHPSFVAHREGRCLAGHDMSEHGRTKPDGRRFCALCARDYARRRRAGRTVDVDRSAA